MANVILKSVKFTKILNGRLSFSSLKPYYINGRYIVRSYKQTRQTKAYSTAAYKLDSNEESVMKNNIAASSAITKDTHLIDDALSKIDSLVRRNGRTQMKNISEVFSSITSKEMTSSKHGLYLIRSCKYCVDEPPSKRIELVNQIWNRYQELGIEFDVGHYNALLDVHISNGLHFNPVEILGSMEDANITPNKGTYLLIMKKYCQDGNIEGASEILQYMKKEGLSADEKVFSYLIEGYIKNNDFTGAKDMIEVMRSSNLQPTADTHSIFACGSAAIGDKNEMMSYLKECGEGAKNYLKVIDVLATSGNYQYIDEVLSLIQHKELYAQEFINAAVELIHKDHLDIAYKLIVASCSSAYNEGTIIFIKQLIKGEKPVSEVVQFCERILHDGRNQNIFLISSRIAADNGQLDVAVALFKKMIDNGYYVRPSNFWPFFTSLKEQKSATSVWLVLKKMRELGIPADFATYLDVLYPILGVPRPNDVLHNVKESGQIMETAADSLFIYYCSLGEIDYAVNLIENFPVNVRSKFDIETLLKGSVNLNKESMNKYLKVLKYIFMGDNSSDLSFIQGKLLAQLIMKKINVLESLIAKYEDLTFSQKVLSICEREIIQRNPARQPFVKKLKSINLERKSLLVKENLSVEDENKYINFLRAQDIPCAAFLTKRIQHHIRTKNGNRVSELLALFQEMKLTYSPLMFANLITMYCATSDIEKARETVSKLMTEFPSFRLDLTRALDYLTLLIKYEKFDESFEVLKNFLKEPYTYSNKDSVLRSVRRLSLYLGDTKDVEFVEKIQNLLLPLSNELGSKKIFLEPVILHYLQRNDLASAFEEFKNVAEKHHILACLKRFLRKCVVTEDKHMLQKVMDVAVSCSGKSVTLLELAVIFIETFNIQRAVRIIENFGTEIRPKDLEEMCMKLSHQNELANLERLLYVTRSLNHVDKENLYMIALRACATKKDFERALKLYNILQREVPDLKPENIQFIENFLKQHIQPDLLTHTSEAPLEKSPSMEDTKTLIELVEAAPSENMSSAMEATKTFIEFLEAGDAEAALNELNMLKKGYIRTLSLKTLTDLIDLCLKKNCTNDLSRNVQGMSYIIENAKDILKPLLEKYSSSGDVEKFVAISNFMPDFSLMSANFNSYFCKAYIFSGKHESLLSQLEQRIDKKNKLFSSLAFEELLKFPEYEDRVFKLAVKYLDVNYTAPMTVVWAHYFIKENFEKAEEIYKAYPFQLDRTDLLIKEIRQNENVSLAMKFVDFVKTLNVRSRVKGRAYGAALELLVMKGMHDEAVALVVESEKLNLLLHKYYVKPLITLKNALEKENKSVPFTIPLDVAADSSSDSE